MDFITPACPPTPTLDELLKSGNFIEVNVKHLVPGEIVVLMEQVAMNPDTKKFIVLIFLITQMVILNIYILVLNIEVAKQILVLVNPIKTCIVMDINFIKKKS